MTRWFATMALLGLLSCGGGELGEACENEGDCASGLTCHTWPCAEGESECVMTCEQVCTSDDECEGSRCSGGFCLH